MPTPLPPAPDVESAPSEPLVGVGATVAVVVAVIALLVSFGVKLTEDQRTAIVAVVGAAAPIVAALWGRRTVWSPRTVLRKIEQVRADPAAK
jgi:hypothetical protein